MNFKVRELGAGKFDDDDPGSWMLVSAPDAETAAERFVEDIHPYSEGQDEFEVEVMSEKDRVSRWEVSAEYEPVFYARKAAELAEDIPREESSE